MRLALPAVSHAPLTVETVVLCSTTEILAEIAELARQQLAAMENARFTGWSSGQRAGFLERSNCIVALRHELMNYET